jgi:hypothetical protein
MTLERARLRSFVMRRALPILLLFCLLAVPASALAKTKLLLPDLEQETPMDLGVQKVITSTGAVQWHLGFRSAVRNVGAGPLIVVGKRASTAEPMMDATQIIKVKGGGERKVRHVGHMMYIHAETHQHWHLMGFDRYELRTADGKYKRVRKDQKQGFCLGDRYDTTAKLPNKPKKPAYYDVNCGYGLTDLLSVLVGISVAWADDYRPYLEGQFVDVTGLKAGVYYLVHRANGNHALHESDYKNNAAGIRIRVSWPDGMANPPKIKTVSTCGWGTHCHIR